jgi:subtilisin family serine protease
VGGDSDVALLRIAVERAIAKDVVVVAAVGNRPANGRQYPAAYPGVIGAGGTNRDGDQASNAIRSPAAVLAAPAEDIVSTGSRAVTPGGYRSGTGTSAATAIIAGVAALVRSEFPDLSAAEVIHRMTATAIDKGEPGRDNAYGYGIVDPVAALTADVPPLDPSGTPAATPSASSGSASGDGASGTPAGWLVGGGVGVLLIVGLVLALRRRAGT